MTYKKVGHLRYLSHLDLLGALERALRRSGLPLWWRRGFNPRPRIAAGPALPLGMESLAEDFAFALEDQVDPARAKACLVPQLPLGLELVAIAPGRLPAPPATLEYLAIFDGPLPPAAELERRLAALEGITDGRGRHCSLAGVVAGLAVEGDRLRLTLAATAGRLVRPEPVIRALGLAAPVLTQKMAAPQRPTDTRTNTKECNVTQTTDQRSGSGGTPDRRGGERASPGDPHLQPEP